MQSEDGTGHGVEWRTRGEAVFSYAKNEKHAKKDGARGQSRSMDAE